MYLLCFKHLMAFIFRVRLFPRVFFSVTSRKMHKSERTAAAKSEFVAKNEFTRKKKKSDDHDKADACDSTQEMVGSFHLVTISC